MRILLLALNAKYIHTNPALYSLRQYAVQKAGEDGAFYAKNILLREYTINHEPGAVLRGIYELRPQVLCISCYLWNIRMVRELVADYKKIAPGVHIYLGGPEVSYDAKECLRQMPGIDGVMVGEGEETFWELARCYFGEMIPKGCHSVPENAEREIQKEKAKGEVRQGKGMGQSQAAASETICGKTEENSPSSDPREKIRSLAYRAADGSIRANALREPLDFSHLPFPYADMDGFADFEHKIIYYETSRGCPFSCCYCLSSVEKTLRLRDLALVEKELGLFLKHRVAQVKFVDRTFNCNKAHAMQIWQYLHDHDNGVTNFHFEIAADLLDDEQVALLAKMRPGLVQLEIGVQSTNPHTVAAIHRRMDLKKVAARVAQVRAARNIHQHLDLIAGLPYEDYASFSRSFDDVYRMKPDQLQLGFLKVLKGSAMADMTQEHGVLYQSEPPYEVLSTKYLPYADLLRLKDIEEMVEVYYNSGQFLHAIPYLEAHFARPFVMFEALADYCRGRGLLECRHGRLEWYEILYRFAQEVIEGKAFVQGGGSEGMPMRGKSVAEAFAHNEFAKATSPQIMRMESPDDLKRLKKPETTENPENREDFLACLAECLCYDLYSRERPKALPGFARPYAYAKQQPRELFAAFGVQKEHAGQCYVAHFCYDMEAALQGETRKRETDCLFDYTVRDPLSGVCAVSGKEAEDRGGKTSYAVSVKQANNRV